MARESATKGRAAVWAAAAGVLAGIAFGATAEAQSSDPATHDWKLSPSVMDRGNLDGIQGRMTLTCADNPAQRVETSFSRLGGYVSRQSRLSCTGPYRIDGVVWRSGEPEVECDHFWMDEPSTTKPNIALWQVVRDDDGLYCVMLGLK